MKRVRRAAGFTIVELLIVIVVIAILAAITVVAFNGIQQRADMTARLQEMSNWKRVFLSYKAANGDMPSVPSTGYYCLGTGFPVGAGGVARCRDFNSTGTGYPESDAVSLMNQLRTISTIPTNTKKPISNAVVGPYAYIDTTTKEVVIVQVFSPSSSACPEGTTQEWHSSTARWCQMLVAA